MAKKKNGDESEMATTQTTTDAQDAEVTADVPAQATDDKEVRRGLGAPPPGTKGDVTERPIEPGEPETG